MALKHYNPTSPAQRGLVLVDKSGLWKGKPVKALTEGKHKTGGRNNKGHVTSRGIAGGHKQRYRFIDFKRRKWDMEATVERIEIGRAHVRTPVPNANIVCRLLLEKKK